MKMRGCLAGVCVAFGVCAAEGQPPDGRIAIDAAWHPPSASEDGGALCWQTSVERGVVGFELSNGAFIAASNSVSGARYRVPLKESIGTAGEGFEVRIHLEDGAVVVQRLAWGMDPAPQTVDTPIPSPSAFRMAATAGDGAVAGVNLFTQSEGVHFVSYASLAAHVGSDAAEVRQRMNSGGWTLQHRGTSVAVREDAAGSGVFVFAPRQEVLWYAGSVLQFLPGTRREPLVGLPAPDPTVALVDARLTRVWEEDRLAILTLPGEAMDDFWVWENLLGSHPTFGRRVHSLVTPDASIGAEGLFRLRVASTSEAAHLLTVDLNGNRLGQQGWSGSARQTLELVVPAGWLRSGTNELVIRSSGDRTSLVYVDSMSLTYRSTSRTQRPDQVLVAAGTGALAWAGTAAERPMVWDVTEPWNPRSHAVVWRSGAWMASVEAGRRYVAWRGVDAPAPTRWSAWTATEPADHAGGVLYAVADELVDGATRWAAWRAEGGVPGGVVSRTRIESEAAHGYPDPRALRLWLRMQPARPGAVLVMGDGGHDFRTPSSATAARFPSLMIRTPYGRAASDVATGDLDGDGWVDVGVFRLPVKTLGQMETLRSRILSVEADPEAMTGEAMLVADQSGEAGDFTADNGVVAERLARRFPTRRLEAAVLGTAGVRTALLGGLAQGVPFWNYIGHGSRDRLGTGYFLATDVATVAFGRRMSVFTAMTCSVGQFDVPGSDCLAETLLLSAGRAPVAVWAPTGFAVHFQSALLNQAWADALATAAPGERWGTVIADARRRFREAGGDPEASQVFTTFGDPSFRLGQAAPGWARASQAGVVDGRFRVVFEGASGAGYAIEATPDPVRPAWQRIADVVADASGRFEWSQPVGIVLDSRFFRAVPR